MKMRFLSDCLSAGRAGWALQGIVGNSFALQRGISTFTKLKGSFVVPESGGLRQKQSREKAPFYVVCGGGGSNQIQCVLGTSFYNVCMCVFVKSKMVVVFNSSSINWNSITLTAKMNCNMLSF